jgi:hypothetical protein
MRRTFVTLATAVLCGLVSAADSFLGERDLQALPPTPTTTSTTRSLKYYGDDVKIPYN